MAGKTDFPPVERRHNHRLRDLFEEAYERVLPCLDPRQTWGRVPLEHLAFRMLREAYPDLFPQEIHALIRASVRVCRERMREESVLPQTVR